MSNNSSFIAKENGRTNSFQDRLDDLFEELALAVRWQRPSILFAIYESESVRKNTERVLEGRLRDLNQEVFHFRVNNKHFDIPMTLSTYENRTNTVFFVSNIKWGGGKGGYNAYRALNLRRELFVDNQIRVVFWLTRTEAENLSKRAPDFWAFRHRVIEFTEQPVGVGATAIIVPMIWDERLSSLPVENIEAKISYRENVLSELPDHDEAIMTRVGIQFELAYYWWLKGKAEKSLDLLKAGLGGAKRVGRKYEAKFMIGKGVILYERGEIERAISAFQDALRLNPSDAVAYANLAAVYQRQGNYDLAIRSAKKAVEISPKEASFWVVMGNIYFEQEILEESKTAFLKAVKFDPQKIKAWNMLGKIYFALNRSSLAIRAFRRGIKFAPRSIESWENLGAIYQSLERKNDAKKTYETLLEIDPENSQALQFLGRSSTKYN